MMLIMILWGRDVFVLSNELMLLVRHLAQSLTFKTGQTIGTRGFKVFKISS